MSSRMFAEICEKLGLAYSISTEYRFFSDIGLIATQAGIAHNNLTKAVRAILNQYQKIAGKEVSTDELNRAKEMLKGGLLIDMEDSEELACNYGLDELLRAEIETIKETIEKYQAVSADDVLRCAKKYLQKDKVIISAVGRDVDKNSILKLITNNLES